MPQTQGTPLFLVMLEALRADYPAWGHIRSVSVSWKEREILGFETESLWDS
jgi:hypothetical protein